MYKVVDKYGDLLDTSDVTRFKLRRHLPAAMRTVQVLTEKLNCLLIMFLLWTCGQWCEKMHIEFVLCFLVGALWCNFLPEKKGWYLEVSSTLQSLKNFQFGLSILLSVILSPVPTHM